MTNQEKREGNSWRARYYRAKDKLVVCSNGELWTYTKRAQGKFDGLGHKLNQAASLLEASPDSEELARQALELAKQTTRVLQKEAAYPITDEAIDAIEL